MKQNIYKFDWTFNFTFRRARRFSVASVYHLLQSYLPNSWIRYESWSPSMKLLMFPVCLNCIKQFMYYSSSQLCLICNQPEEVLNIFPIRTNPWLAKGAHFTRWVFFKNDMKAMTKFKFHQHVMWDDSQWLPLESEAFLTLLVQGLPLHWPI